MCLVYHTLFADETTPTPKSDAHLYGHVIDSKTGEHLPYATVTIPGTTIGTMTDASGHYFLKNLPTEPFVSGTIRPHVPIGAAKHRFHRVFSLIGRITGRCPYLAKTDPFYILKHRIILCIHLGA